LFVLQLLPWGFDPPRAGRYFPDQNNMDSGTGIFWQENFGGRPHNWPPPVKQAGGLQFGLLVMQSVIGVTGWFMGMVLGAP
jgi:hypothetical protein